MLSPQEDIFRHQKNNLFFWLPFISYATAAAATMPEDRSCRGYSDNGAVDRRDDETSLDEIEQIRV